MFTLTVGQADASRVTRGKRRFWRVAELLFTCSARSVDSRLIGASGRACADVKELSGSNIPVRL